MYKRIFRQDGVEVWKIKIGDTTRFLVVNRLERYGRFCNTLEEAKKDDLLKRVLYGVKIKVA